MRAHPSLLPVLGLMLATTACALPAQREAAPGGNERIEGNIASIDTQPWSYDGHAVVEVDVPGRGRVPVQLPARWNLCQAAAVDVQSLAVGMHVQAVGALEDDGAITICADRAHQLVPR